MNDITRRAFLKAGGVLSTVLLADKALAALNLEQLLDDGFVALRSGKFLQLKPTTCLECAAGCGLIGFLGHRDVLAVHGNPRDPNSLGRVCARGIAGINKLKDAERVLTPLKRTNNRGESGWQPISWNEALRQITSRLDVVRDSGSHESFVFDQGDEANPGIILDFLDAFGSPLYLSRARSEQAARIAACYQTVGEDTLVPDVSRSKYIINFGANPYEHHEQYVPMLYRLLNCRVEHNAKMITFDVRLSNTAAKSDEWIPNCPGSDGFLSMAMANFIIQNDLHDRDFVTTWMNCTEGQLREYLSRFSLDDAEDISGVKKERIAELARDFATAKPSVAISGNGIRMQSYGSQQEMAILLLNAISGSLDVPGGLCLPRRFSLRSDASGKPKDTVYDTGTFFRDVESGQRNISVYIACNSNPAYSSADCKAVERILKNEGLVPYLVVIDTHLTETAKVADLVLPAAAPLESWGIESRPSLNLVPQVNLVQPLVPPSGQARGIADILIGIANLLGGEFKNRFPFRTVQDHIASVLSTHVPDAVEFGGLSYLRKHGLWFDRSSRPNYKLFEDVKFNTPSQKYEVFCASSDANIQERYTILKRAARKTGGLVMTTFQSGLRSSMNSNCKWTTEISHRNELWIHPDTASEYGVSDRDLVEISSETGSINVALRVTWGIRPGVVAMATGFGHEADGSVSRSNQYLGKDQDTELIWWKPRKSGANPSIVFPVATDPFSGGQQWKAIDVRLKKC